MLTTDGVVIQASDLALPANETLPPVTIKHARDEAERDALLLPCDVLVQHFPKLELNDYAVTMLKHGQRPQFTEDISAVQPIRVYSRDGTFIGLVEYQKEIGRLKALRLMNTADK